ncbi:MAG: P-loop NTPase fold protein [Aquisalimonadaceae bacterium]
MLNDRPIQAVEQDALDRGRFADVLAQTLLAACDQGGLVVGIEGAWGEGKTSVLNLMEAELKRRRQGAVVVRFEPWLISNAETLCEAFLVQIAAVIGTAHARSSRARAVASHLLSFAKMLGPVKLIPGVEPWGTLAQTVTQQLAEGATGLAQLGAMDLHTRKEQINKSIRTFGRPIVVLVDDIDRMTPQEVREVFRFVKAVGDFDGVTYVLAYERGEVTGALQSAGIHSSDAYLEKIIQLSYPLPKLSMRRLVQLFERHLEEFIATHLTRDEALKEHEQQRLDELVARGLLRALRRPRDIIRLVNRLLLSVPATRGQVNFADVVAFETLSFRFPRIVDAVRRNPSGFVGAVGLAEEDPDVWARLVHDHEAEEGRDELAGWKKQLLATVPDNERELAERLLSSLFPEFLSNWDHNPADAAARRLVCHGPTLRALLGVGYVYGLPNATDIERLLLRRQGRREHLRDAAEDETIGTLLTALRDELHGFQDIAQIEDPADLIIGVAEATSLQLDGQSTAGWPPEAAIFAREVISITADQAHRVDLSTRFVTDGPSLSVLHDFVLMLARDHDLWPIRRARPGGVLIEDTQAVRQLIDVWLDRVARTELDDLASEPRFLSILFRWGQLQPDGVDYSVPARAVTAWTHTDTGMERFLDAANGSEITPLAVFFDDRPTMATRLRNKFGYSAVARELADALDSPEPEE